MPLGSVSIVNQYEDVFGEITCLPPKRDATFFIDLVPGTLPISRTPYRMVEKEMFELRKQLNELERVGLIRESHSPWGAPVLFV